MSRYCKLILVSGEVNSNKFYEMKQVGNIIEIEYGRIQGGKQKTSKPLSKWDSIYKSKLRKGYKDCTPIMSPNVPVKMENSKSHPFIDKMMQYRDNRVTKTYMVGANDVTDSQKVEAQEIINNLAKSKDETKQQQERINRLLLDLYTIIPRKMKDTREHIFPQISNFRGILKNEQDNLDSISSIAINESQLDVTLSSNDLPISYLENQLKNRYEIYSLNSNRENIKFGDWLSNVKNKNTKYLIHGTRCSSVIPILESKLMIRPTGNFHYSGSAYGDGIYCSDSIIKSSQYVGNDHDKVFLICECHTGNQKIYNGWRRSSKDDIPLTQESFKRHGFDSLHVKAGDGLMRDEFIFYNEPQVKICGVIWCN